MLDVQGNIPTFIEITPSNVHEINILEHFVFEAGSFYIMDRSYIDFERLYQLNQHRAFFVVRSTGLRCDQTIALTGFYTSKGYLEKLRRIMFYDDEHDIRLTFLANNFILPALTIARLYKRRWQIELFQMDQTTSADQSVLRDLGV